MQLPDTVHLSMSHKALINIAPEIQSTVSCRTANAFQKIVENSSVTFWYLADRQTNTKKPKQKYNRPSAEVTVSYVNVCYATLRRCLKNSEVSVVIVEQCLRDGRRHVTITDVVFNLFSFAESSSMTHGHVSSASEQSVTLAYLLHLDYCNSLLFGVADNLLQRLQSVQNAADAPTDH